MSQSYSWDLARGTLSGSLAAGCWNCHVSYVAGCRFVAGRLWAVNGIGGQRRRVGSGGCPGPGEWGPHVPSGLALKQ